MDFSTQFNLVQNSIVRILSIEINGANQVLKSSGSGVLFGDGRRALTCNHCIVPNTTIVALHSGQAAGQIGTVVFSDVNLDIAILEFPASIGPGATIKSSDGIGIGQEAFVAGFHMSSNTITALSAHVSGFEIINGINYIKIDSSINHGNSGGPLFNSNGEVIGIVNAKKGNLSDLLVQIEQLELQGGVFLHGIDPIQVIKQLIKEMKSNLNLGIGTVIPTRLIANATALINGVLV